MDNLMKKLLCHLLILAALLIILPVQATTNSLTKTTGNVIPINTPKSIDSIVGNYNNKIDIVFSDIDGTLLPQYVTINHIPQSVKEASKKLNKSKIPFVIVTGRPYHFAKEFAKKIGDKNTYIVTMQGSQIYDNKGRVIYKDCVNNQDALEILDSITKFVEDNHFNSKIFTYVDEQAYSTRYFVLPDNLGVTKVVKSYRSLGNFTPNKINVWEPDPKKLDTIKTYLEKTFPDYYVYLSSRYFCDINTYTATKGHGVEQVAKILGKDLKNAATFGDAGNDVSMINAAKNAGGLGVAVENAMDVLKQNANYETTNVTNGGVPHAIDKILENNKLLNKE